MPTLLINEIFGPTVQGEGPASGQPCAFVRLAICPLECVWCDTAYTWAYTDAKAAKHQSRTKYDRASEVHQMEVEDITAQAVIATGGSRLVIISGGEPLAQTPPRFQGKRVASIAADPLGLLIYNLYIRNVGTHIETAGIRVPSDLVNDHVGRYVVSPKLETSGNKLVQRHVPEALTFFAGTYKADFKFVITSPTDFIEIDSIIKAYSIQPSRVWCMPEGTTPEAVQRSMPMIAAEALQRGYNVCTRLHVLIWGDERAH